MNVVGDMGDPIITPVPLLVSIKRALGVSSDGSHAAAHITPSESYLASLSSVSASRIGGAAGGGMPAGGGGGGAPQ